MRIAHVLPGFDAIGETYIYNFVHYHKRSEPFVIVPPSHNLDAVRLPGNKVTLCRDWLDLERVLEREQIDVVHAHTGLGGTLALIPLQRFRLPLVVSFYGIEMGAERHDRVRQEAYRVLFRTASRVLVPSVYHKRRLIEAGCAEPKLRVVNLGVNVVQFNRSDAVNRYDRLRVLCVGRLVERKGLLDAIEAFREALIDAPGMELYIAGEGPMRREIERYIAKLGLRDVVFLLGSLPNNMIAELMQRTDIFLLPCVTTNEGDEDGAPITLLEAQACGIPVVSTRHGGIPEMVCDGESGFLVAEHDIHGLSSALVKLALDRKLRRTMGETGRSLVEKTYDIEKKIVELEGLYADLVGRQVWYSPGDFYPVAVDPKPGLTRILVLHEGSVLTLYSRLLYLRDRYPGSQISVVMPEPHAPLLRELSFIENVYPVPGDLVRFLTASRRFIWQLRRQHFDLAVISAEAEDPEDQIDLEFLALAFGALKTTYLTPEYVEVAVSFKHALRGFVHRHEALSRVTDRLPRVLQNYFRRDA